MFGFFKKVKSWFVGEAEVLQTPVAPYKIEAPVNPQITDAVTTKPAAVKLRKPGQPRQGVKKPAGQKPQGQKPAGQRLQGQKPTGQKKPAQPKTQGGQKPAGNKPRGRKPKAKPAAQ